MTDIPEDIMAKAFPEREIFAYGRYLRCQILNWEHGSPPPYIVCNPLDKDYREQFLAAPSMGTWARVDLREVAQAYAALVSERTAQEAEIARLTAEVERLDLCLTAADKSSDENFTIALNSAFDLAASKARVAELEKALKVARNRVIALGGNPHPHDLNADQVQVAVLTVIQAALDAALTPAKENTDAG